MNAVDQVSDALLSAEKDSISSTERTATFNRSVQVLGDHDNIHFFKVLSPCCTLILALLKSLGVY